MSAKEKMVQRATQAFSNTSYRPDAHLTTPSWPISWEWVPKKLRTYSVRQRKLASRVTSSTIRRVISSRLRRSTTSPPTIW